MIERITRWSLLAHEGQVPPKDKQWFTYLMRSGRGGGKTRAGSEWILDRVRNGAKSIALIGKTVGDIRDTMVERGESSIMRVARPHERPIYEPSKRRLTFPNGAVATTFSAEEPDQLRGPQHDTVWIDELAKFPYPDDLWDNMIMGLRLGKDPKVFVTTTPRPLPLIKRLVNDPLTIDVRFSTFQNADNLAPQFLKNIKDLYEGTRLGRQEIYGEILDDNPFALWTHTTIDVGRVNHTKAVKLARVVVGVDPAVSYTAGSDLTGIVVAGVSDSGQYYILGDYSMAGSPLQWAGRVVRAYHEHSADRIIGEVNNGGDLIETVLRQVDAKVSYRKVTATRGKAVRAEPIAALYEQGKVHHVGSMPDLEDQMCEWVPNAAGQKSPDRMDALVWALTDLVENNGGPNRFGIMPAHVRS